MSVREKVRVSCDAPVRSLFDPAACRSIESLVDSLPDFGGQFGFECRLHDGRGAQRVDFGALIRPSVDGVALFRAAFRTVSCLPDLADQANRVSEFVAEWTRPDSLLASRIPFLLMEFDVHECSSAMPSLFLALDWEIGGSEMGSSSLQAAEGAVRILLGSEQARATVDELARAAAVLSSNARVIHVGLMLGRGTRRVRLSIAQSWSSLKRCLVSLDWRFDAAPVDALVRRFAPFSTFHDRRELGQVDLDVGESDIGAELGITLRPPHGMDWCELLDHVLGEHLCTADKHRAVLEWPAVLDAARLNGSPPIVLRREISHVKLTYLPDAATTAKAYLTVTPQRLRFS